jgi:hypothetical protein
VSLPSRRASCAAGPAARRRRAVFLFATALNAFVLTKRRPAATRRWHRHRVAALSFGIGMLGGGLRHFEDFPERAAMLISRREPARWRSILGPAGMLVPLAAALAFVGLRGIADGMAAESGGGGQSHGEGTAPTERGSGARR